MCAGECGPPASFPVDACTAALALDALGPVRALGLLALLDGVLEIERHVEQIFNVTLVIFQREELDTLRRLELIEEVNGATAGQQAVQHALLEVRRERSLDVPPQPVQVHQRALVAILQRDLVAVLPHEMRRFNSHRTDADAFDLQQRVIVSALVNVAVGVAADPILVRPEHHLFVDRVETLTARAPLWAGVIPDMVAVPTAPLPPEPPQGVDPPLPLPVDLIPGLPDGFKLEGSGLIGQRRGAGHPVVAGAGAPLRQRHLAGVQHRHVPAHILRRREQVPLDVSE